MAAGRLSTSAPITLGCAIKRTNASMVLRQNHKGVLVVQASCQ
jgi:hypothetical protein